MDDIYVFRSPQENNESMYQQHGHAVTTGIVDV